jgi:hypothetical protein
MVKALSGKGAFKATVVCMKDTAETRLYADEFVKLLQGLNWDVVRKGSDTPDVGIWVGVSSLSHPAPGADLLLKALQGAGIELTYDHVTRVLQRPADRCRLEVGYEAYSPRPVTRI